jgi:hypothetical protein
MIRYSPPTHAANDGPSRKILYIANTSYEMNMTVVEKTIGRHNAKKIVKR